MPARPIVYADNPLLRRKSRHIQRVTPTIERLIEDMVETMHAAEGIGLAAIQIGVPERLIVVELPEDPEAPDDPDRGKLFVVLNPEVARRSREVEEGTEGCLSVPGWAGKVSRPVAVTVKGLDRRGKPVRIKARDLLARVFQHEIDHCDGVIFTDHITDPEKIWEVEKGSEEAAEAEGGRKGATSA